ncbi:MAG: hypothetical protein ACR2NJ_00415, partial [Acidimicrobiales bacterium]
ARPRVVEVVGDVVRHPAAAWTETVHALLRHLFDEGLPVPEPLGIKAGVEMVRFIPGDAGEKAWPHQTSIAGVRSAGQLSGPCTMPLPLGSHRTMPSGLSLP